MERYRLLSLALAIILQLFKLSHSQQIGAPYEVDYIFNDSTDTLVYTSKWMVNWRMTEARPTVQIDVDGIGIELTYPAPTYRYSMAEIGRVPEYAHLRTAMAVLSKDAAAFQSFVDQVAAVPFSQTTKLNQNQNMLRGEIPVPPMPGPWGKVIDVVNLLVGLAALGWDTGQEVEIKQLFAQVGALSNKLDGVTDNLNKYKNQMDALNANYTAYLKLQNDRDNEQETELRMLRNQTASEQGEISLLSQWKNETTQYLFTENANIQAALDKKSQELIDIQNEMEREHIEDIDFTKQQIRNVTRIISELNLLVMQQYQYIRDTVEEHRRQNHGMYVTFQKTMSDDEIRRTGLGAVGQALASVDLEKEFALLSSDFRPPNASAGTQTLVERYYINYIEYRTAGGDPKGATWAVQRQVRFYMDTAYGVDNVYEFDTAETLLWSFVQPSCRRTIAVGEDLSTHVPLPADELALNTKCRMWVEVRTLQCQLLGAIKETWHFKSNGAAPDPSVCASSTVIHDPSPSVSAVLLSNFDDWRAWLKENVCHQPLRDGVFNFDMYVNNGNATVNQNTTICDLDYDLVIKHSNGNLEKTIVDFLGTAVPMLLHNLALNGISLFGMSPNFGLSQRDQTINSLVDDGTHSLAMAQQARMRLLQFNVVSRKTVPLYHVEPTQAGFINSDPVIRVLYTPLDTNYVVDKDSIISPLSTTPEVTSLLPGSFTFAGDLTDTVDTFYDVPEYMLSTAPESRARTAVTALLMPKATPETCDLAHMMAFNGASDPMKVVSLDTYKVAKAVIQQEGPDHLFPYCVTSGGTPENQSVGNDDRDGRVSPNGDLCNTMRHYNVYVEGGYFYVRPKKYSVQLQLEIPSGRLRTILGKGACLKVEITTVSSGQLSVVLKNENQYQAIDQYIVAYNMSSNSACRLNQTVTVPRLSTMVVALPTCSSLIVAVYQRKAAGNGPSSFAICTTFSPVDTEAALHTYNPSAVPDKIYVESRISDVLAEINKQAIRNLDFTMTTIENIAAGKNLTNEISNEITDLLAALAAAQAKVVEINISFWQDSAAELLKKVIALNNAGNDLVQKVNDQFTEDAKHFADQDALLADTKAKQEDMLYWMNVAVERLRNSSLFDFPHLNLHGGGGFDFFGMVIDAIDKTVDLVTSPFDKLLGGLSIGNMFSGIIDFVVTGCIAIGLCWVVYKAIQCYCSSRGGGGGDGGGGRYSPVDRPKRSSKKTDGDATPINALDDNDV